MNEQRSSLDVSPRRQAWAEPGLADTAMLIPSLSKNYLDTVQDLRQIHGDFVHFRHARLLFVYDVATIREILVTDVGNYRKGTRNSRAVLHLAGKNLQIMEGSEWKQGRMLTEPFYSRRYFEDRLADADRVIQRRVDVLGSRLGTAVDLHRELQTLMLEIVNAMYLDLDEDALAEIAPSYLSIVSQQFLRYVSLPFWPIFRSLPLPLHRREKRTLASFDALIGEKIRERARVRPEANDQPAVLGCQHAREAAGEVGFTEAERLDHAKGLLLGSTLGLGLSVMWAFYFACETPGVQERVRDEVNRRRDRNGSFGPADIPALSFTRNVHLESLRLLPPAHTLERKSIDARTLGGHVIPANTSILIPIYAIHRDSRHWRNPDAFLPDRFDGDGWRSEPAFMPFALGTRACIARKLSLAIACLVIARMFDAFEIRLEPGFRPVLHLNPEISTANGMFVRVRPNPPAPMRFKAGAPEPAFTGTRHPDHEGVI